MINRESCFGCPVPCDSKAVEIISKLALGKDYVAPGCTGPETRGVIVEDSPAYSWEDAEVTCPKENVTVLRSELNQ